MPILNLTPHPLQFFHSAQDPLNHVPPYATILPHEKPLRLPTTTTLTGTIEGIPLLTEAHTTRSSEARARGAAQQGGASSPLEDLLPPVLPDTIYIVSRVIALRFPSRTDFVFPTNFVRDSDGHIIGATALARVA